MPTVESIAQTKPGLRHLQLISTLTEAVPLDGQGQVGVGALYEDAKQRGIGRQGVTSDLEALQDKGWLWFERSATGIQTVVLKQPGIDAAEEFKALRNDRVRRARAIRTAILSWLYDLHFDDKEAPEIDYMLTTGRCMDFGDPFTPKELAREAKWLLAEGLIQGFQAISGVLRQPTITNKGIAVVENDGSTGTAARGGDIYNIHNSGAFNWAQNSSNFSQSNTLTQGQIEQVEKMLGQVRALLTPVTAGVSDDVASQAQVIAGQLEEEIKSPAPQPTVVKALGLKLMELAATGTVQGVVDALNTVITQGITGIG